MNFKDLAIKDLGADAHPEDVAYHVAWLRSLSRHELLRYRRKLARRG